MTTLKLKKTLNPGKYNATIESIEEKETKFGPTFKFVYATDDGQEASELVNMSYTKKTKLGKRVWEILREMPEELNINRLIGARVLIELEEAPDSDFCKVISVKRQQETVQAASQAVSSTAGVNSEAPF